MKSLQDIYEAISRISNCSTIIDSSKSPCRALSISNLSPAVDLRIVHLVRDGRAVLWSMLKKHKKKSTAPLSKRRELTTLFRTIIGWTLINIQSEIVGKIFGSKRYLRIRYEDLVKNNESFLLKISKSIDQPILAPNQIFGTGGQYRANHLVAGNDMRFQKIITLRPDFEWRNKLPLEYKFIFQFFGKVLLKRYGYMKSIS